MNWLDSAFVCAIHRGVMQRTPLEDDGIRDGGKLLEPALMRPQMLQYYEGIKDLFELAAAYCIAISIGHPFNNGNKRTAFLSMLAFLALNGRKCRLPNTPETARYMEQVAMGEIEREELAAWLKENAIAA